MLKDRDTVRVDKGVTRKTLPVIVAIVIICAVAAGFVGGRFSTPSEQAKFAKVPKASLITTRIGWGQLNATVTLRANVVDIGETAVGIPGDLNGDLPVVTRLSVEAGSIVRVGSVPFAVAGRPVILMVGQIPAYRDMSVGDNGVDVEQLQKGLVQLGFGLGGDTIGEYGVGTAGAVFDLYRGIDFDPVLATPMATNQPILAAGTASTTSTPAPETAEVPRGEIVFVPVLPQQVVALNVGLGGTISANGGPICSIGSGQTVFQGDVDQADLGQIKVGDKANITAATSNQSTSGTVSFVSNQGIINTASGNLEYAVSLVPDGPVATSWVGQNVGVQIDIGSSHGNTWIVPVAAIRSDAGGGSFVTIALGGGRTKSIGVTPGLVNAGQEAIAQSGRALRKGDLVVVGAAESS